jgi:hypothetical protein
MKAAGVLVTDFATAWSLGSSRIAEVRGTTVRVVLSAVQTDGSTRAFSDPTPFPATSSPAVT